jgi:hypothetical protein
LEPLIEAIAKAGGNTYHLPAITRGVPIGPTKLQILSISSNDTDYFIIQIHSAMRISILPDFFGDGIPYALLHILVAVC